MPVVAEDRPRRLPLHPRLVRPLPLLPGRQPRPGGHRPAQGAALPRALKDTPRAEPFDLAKETDDELRRRLVEQPERLSTATSPSGCSPSGALAPNGQRPAVCRDARPRRPRPTERADARLWALVGAGPLDADVPHARCSTTTTRRSAPGAFRAAGNMHGGRSSSAIATRSSLLARDPSPDVGLQVAIAARKLGERRRCCRAARGAAQCGDDPLIPHIVWQNLHPLLEDQGGAFVRLVEQARWRGADPRRRILPRAIERLLGRASAIRERSSRWSRPWPPPPTRRASTRPPAASSRCSPGRDPERRDRRAGALAHCADGLQPLVRTILAVRKRPRCIDAALLATSWNDADAAALARRVFRAARASRPSAGCRRLPGPGRGRRYAVDPRRTAHDGAARGGRLARLPGRCSPRSALARRSPRRPRSLPLPAPGARAPAPRHRAADPAPRVEPRPADAIGANQVPADALNLNQIRKLLESKDPSSSGGSRPASGRSAKGRNPEREQVIATMRTLLRDRPGDPHAAAQVFQESCTSATRSTARGRTSAPTSRSTAAARTSSSSRTSSTPASSSAPPTRRPPSPPRRPRPDRPARRGQPPASDLLKMQGGKLETIARDDIEEMKLSPLSLMPEDLEKQLEPGASSPTCSPSSPSTSPRPTAKHRRIPGTPRGLFGERWALRYPR